MDSLPEQEDKVIKKHSTQVKSNLQKSHKYMNTIKKTMGEIKPDSQPKQKESETSKQSSKITVKVTKKGKKKTSKKKSKAVPKPSTGSVTDQTSSKVMLKLS